MFVYTRKALVTDYFPSSRAGAAAGKPSKLRPSKEAPSTADDGGDTPTATSRAVLRAVGGKEDAGKARVMKQPTGRHRNAKVVATRTAGVAKKLTP